MKQRTLSEIFGLPAAERIRLAQEILESVTEEQDQEELTPEDRAKLDHRLDLIDKYPNRGSSWAQVKRRLHRAKK